jgi:hypothetical protein
VVWRFFRGQGVSVRIPVIKPKLSPADGLGIVKVQKLRSDKVYIRSGLTQRTEDEYNVPIPEYANAERLFGLVLEGDGEHRKDEESVSVIVFIEQRQKKCFQVILVITFSLELLSPYKLFLPNLFLHILFDLFLFPFLPPVLSLTHS